MFWIILVILGILVALVGGGGLCIGAIMLWKELIGDDEDEDESFYIDEITSSAIDYMNSGEHWPNH